MYIMIGMGAAAAPNKHQQKTEATRGKLLKSAMRVFVRDGYEAARIEDIAADAGHSRGAFYANFDTKEDLFLSLLEQQLMSRLEHLRPLIAGAPTRREHVGAMRKYYIDRAADRQWALLALEFKLFALRHKKQRAKLAAAHERIRESMHNQLLAALRKHALLGDKDTKVILEVLLNGLVLEHAYDPKRVSAKEMETLLGRMFDLLIAQ